MAFDWLQAADSALGIAGGLAGIFGSDEPQAPAVLPSMVQASKRSGQIAKALTQNDLGQYSGLVDDISNQYSRDTAAGLKELMEADRQSRIRSASGLGMFQDDRRDETLTREWIRQREGQTQRARDAARGYLTQALNANGVAMGGYGQVAGIQSGVDIAQADYKNRQIESGFQLAGGLLDSIRSARTPPIVGVLNGGSTTSVMNPSNSYYPFVQES